MALGNYRDISTSGADVGAGFQFEFSCAHCSHRWKSDFKPYRVGQLSSLITRFGWIVGIRHGASHHLGSAADMRASGARNDALEAASKVAAKHFSHCGQCDESVCTDCWSARDGSCKKCAGQHSGQAASDGRAAVADRGRGGSAGAACPNCRTALNGGRFCAECGFDMASTHKTCPSCGTMVERQTRFCGDCGHSF